jgi:ATP-dependent exoDNAse (exonuclease V) alpha subunit
MFDINMHKIDSMETEIQIIPEYRKIRELIIDNKFIIFVTGGAGTGKSTLIRWLMEVFKGKVLLGAPTGIAAINIGAKTLHSLCMLPPAWILPQDIKIAYRRNEIRKAKILIIDEISMVNPNMFDAVDLFFKKNRGNDMPFGGLTVVIVGDLYQLPPVINTNMRKMFIKFYNGTKFYNANCFTTNLSSMVVLDTTFRQKDDSFIKLLSNVRQGIDLKNTINALNNGCTITQEVIEGSVRLCPRNSEVLSYNMQCLDELPGLEFMFKGVVEGIFKEDNLPSPYELILKVNAQVMFIKNDVNKQWINGTVGTILSIQDDIITVRLSECGTVVCVSKETWEDFKYTWDDRLHEIQRVVVGSYTQFPLVLAWALTIHKSQGKTISKVHLDLGAGAFETGQTYVALSRCPTLQGISLSREIQRSDIRIDHEVRLFYQTKLLNI